MRKKELKTNTGGSPLRLVFNFFIYKKRTFFLDKVERRQ